MMATIVANATASLSANGTSTVAGSITWTVPALPDGVLTWDSVVISGSWTWNGKGSISRVTINGTNTSADTPFSITLGTSVNPPLSISCVGGNKNATGSNFSWSDLVVTYSYTDPFQQTFYIKVDGSWIECIEVYKKVNGSWVLQDDLESVIDSSKNYVMK